MKKGFQIIIRVLVSLTLIIILLYIMRDKYNQIGLALKNTKPFLFFLSLFGFFAAIAIASVRLRLIIAAQDIAVTFRESLSLTLIGYFFNNFLPTSIGGDVVKAYYLSKKSVDKIDAYTAVFVDRIIGLLTMVFMAFIALFFVNSRVIDDTSRWVIYFITLFSVLFLILMTNKEIARKFSVLLILVRPIEEKLIRAYNGIHGYKDHVRLIVKSFGISIISQCLFFFSIGLLVFSIGSYMFMMDILLRMPLISMISLLPSINGLGVREGSTVLFFGPLIGKENAFVVSILWLFVLLIASVVGGIIYGLSPQFRVRLKDIEE